MAGFEHGLLFGAGADPGPTDKGNVSAQQLQGAIPRELDRSGERTVSKPVDIVGVSDMTVSRDIDVLVADAELDSAARRMVSEQVGQLIVAQPVDDEEGDHHSVAPGTVRSGPRAVRTS